MNMTLLVDKTLSLPCELIPEFIICLFPGQDDVVHILVAQLLPRPALPENDHLTLETLRLSWITGSLAATHLALWRLLSSFTRTLPPLPFLPLESNMEFTVANFFAQLMWPSNFH